jgi:hypothetical protein
MSFGKNFGKILSPFKEEYKGAKNQKERNAVLKNAADALLKYKETLEDGDVDLPSDIQTVGAFFLSSSVFLKFIYDFRLSNAISEVALRRNRLWRTPTQNPRK